MAVHIFLFLLVIFLLYWLFGTSVQKETDLVSRLSFFWGLFSNGCAK